MSSTVQDAARERAVRTFKQQFPIDLAVFLIPLLLEILGQTDKWNSKDFWIVFGVSVGKTVLTILAAYVMRLKNPPREEETK